MTKISDLSVQQLSNLRSVVFNLRTDLEALSLHCEDKHLNSFVFQSISSKVPWIPSSLWDNFLNQAIQKLIEVSNTITDELADRKGNDQ
jgi:hypothetical protein